MLVKRFHEARPYEGFEPGGPANQWIGYSQFLPGGGAGPDSTPFEKVYVVLEGEMTVIVDDQEMVLKPMDSCTIAPNEIREIVNRSNHVCKMLVVIPYPLGTKP
jgi:mannose-6-phosphate isomerase-like protein (cupin superfamily)